MLSRSRTSRVCLGCLAAAVLYSIQAASAQSPLRALTGAQTRVVWVQHQKDNGSDPFARGRDLRLMAYDSDDGKGTRAVLPTSDNYVKPLLTPDGQRIVYSSYATNAFFVVNWDGSRRRKVWDGFAVDMVSDPNDGTVWVYYQERKADTKNPIRRRRLDSQQGDELVWSKTPVSVDSFQVSRNGRYAGGLFPWPNGGIAELPNKTWHKLANGCWTSLIPDNSYIMWIFDGPHRNVYMHEWQQGRDWKLGIGDAPGIKGFEVYHPRWSNHPRVITMTGPYLGKGGKPGGNRIGTGGGAVEIYVGKLDDTLRNVAKWVRVTANYKGDFYPDVWVRGGEAVDSGRGIASRTPTEPNAEHLAAMKAWPGDTSGMVFVWENSKATNQVPGEGDVGYSCRVKESDMAFYNRFHDMDLKGGAVFAEGMDKRLLSACKRTNQLSVEAVITPADLKQAGPARIISFSTDSGSRNFTLGQQDDQLIWRLRTPRTGGNGTSPETALCTLAAGVPHHVVVSYRPGRITCLVNGKPVSVKQAVRGDFSNWSAQHLLFGDEYSRDRDWAGRLEGIAIYSRAIGEAEAVRHYELYRPRLTKRKVIPRWTVQAKLLEKTNAPTPVSIAPYRRCLAVSKYEITKVLAGDPMAPTIAVAEWVIMDGKLLSDQRTEGTVRTFSLEPFEEHAQLKSERLVSDLDDFDLEQFFAR